MKLLNLKGTSITEMDCFFIKKVSEISNITPTLAATAADSNGALNIWLDDDMKFRCESMRWLTRVDYQIYSDVALVKQWYKKWIKEIK